MKKTCFLFFGVLTSIFSYSQTSEFYKWGTVNAEIDNNVVDFHRGYKSDYFVLRDGTITVSSEVCDTLIAIFNELVGVTQVGEGYAITKQNQARLYSSSDFEGVVDTLISGVIKARRTLDGFVLQTIDNNGIYINVFGEKVTIGGNIVVDVFSNPEAPISGVLLNDGSIQFTETYNDVPVELTEEQNSNIKSVFATRNVLFLVKNDNSVLGFSYSNFGSSTLYDLGKLAEISGIFNSLNAVAFVYKDGTVNEWSPTQGFYSSNLSQYTDTKKIIGTLLLKKSGNILEYEIDQSFDARVFKKIAKLDGLVDISQGVSHGLGLRNDGTVIGWGNNNYGQLDVPKKLDDLKAVYAAK